MPVSDLMLAGLELMGLGMGIVFCFLMLLVFSMLGMCKVAQLIEGRSLPQPTGSHDTESTVDEQGDEVISVIAAAVSQYRATHR